MKVLVTGSSGYVGSYLVPWLKEHNYYVTGYDRMPSSTHQEDECIQEDLLNETELQKAVDKSECIIHLAAAKADWGISDEEFFRDNKEATEVLLRAADKAGVKHHLFYSTVAVYGSSEQPKDETAAYAPEIAYGRSKMECEKAYYAFYERNRDAVIRIIRPSVIFGPNQPDSTNVYRLIDAIYKKRFFMIGGGEAFKTTSYIRNLLDANEFIMNGMTVPGVEDYIYVDQPIMQTKELVAHIYDKMNQNGKPLNLPLGLIRPVAKIFDLVGHLTRRDLPVTAARIQKFCTSTNFSSAKIFSEGFRQKHSNEEAVRKTVEWQLKAVYGV